MQQVFKATQAFSFEEHSYCPDICDTYTRADHRDTDSAQDRFSFSPQTMGQEGLDPRWSEWEEINEQDGPQAPQDLSSLFTMVSFSDKDDPNKLTRRTLQEY